MKILSSFTHPQVVPNLYECLCSAEHKGRYFEEFGKQSHCGALLTSMFFFSYYGSQWCLKTAWLQTYLQISSFVFSRTKTFIQVWNYLSVSKWWQNLHFWVNYSFNSMGKNIVQNIFCVPLKKYDCHFCVKFHANSLKAHIHFDMDWTCNPLVRYHKNTQWWTLYEQQS